MEASTLPSVVPQKRPRPVKSCLNCRSKKLKCDREQPCAQCIRRKCIEECDYDEYAGSLGTIAVSSQIPPRLENSNQNARPILKPRPPAASLTPSNHHRINNGEASQESLQARVEDLELRISVLEDVANGGEIEEDNRGNPQILDPLLPGSGEDKPNSRKNVKYFGLSSTRSLISLFPDVGAFLTNALKDPTMKAEFENLNRSFPKDKFNHKKSIVNLDVDSFLSVLPQKGTAERLISVYETYFPKIYQVLDLPTFRQQCNRFYESDQHEGNGGFRADFAPLLALVLAFGAQHGSNVIDAINGLEYRRVCVMVDSWLSSLDFKKRRQPITLQTTCLLVLSMRMLSAPNNQLWQYTGDLVRTAITIGLHKDPYEVDPKMPLLQARLRRSMWYIIASLDVETSMACCMPSLVQATPYSCGVPGGERDDLEDVHNGSEEILYQKWLAKLLPLRLRSLKLLTETKCNAPEIRAIISQLENDRLVLPNQLRYSTYSASSESVGRYNAMLLDMSFRGTALSLNTLGLQCPDYLRNKDDASRSMGLCMAIMAHSEAFESDTGSDDQDIADDILWRIFHSLNSDHILRAAYSSCFCLRILTPGEPNVKATLRPSQPLEVDIPAATIRHTVEDLVRTYLSKKEDLRVILKHILALALASESTKQTRSESRKEEVMKSKLQVLLQMCRERHAADVVYSSSNSRGSMDSDILSMGPSTVGPWDQFAWQDFEFDPVSLNWNSLLFPDG